MKTLTARTSTRLQAALAILAVSMSALVWLFGGAGHAQAADKNPPSDIPEDLRVEGRPLAVVHASGFQVYICKADAAGKLAWTLKAPDATFENDAGLKGKHYAGPTWEAADGSKVTGRKIKEHASSDANAVAWLLLAAKDHEGSGRFAIVTYIQRIRTSGGKPPAIGDAKADAEIRVPYTADYIFYGPGAKTSAASP
jgi:hypothetical protein